MTHFFPIKNVLRLAACALLAGATVPPSAAQQDAAPVDLEQLRQSLRTLKDQQVQLIKGNKQRAIQEATSAAASGTAAAAAWEEAVRRVQFEGAGHEGTQFKDWREQRGDALREKEAQNAARLYFTWLALTLQRASGTTAKDLLPQVISYTQELAADTAAMEAFVAAMDREKELADARRQTQVKKNNDGQVKRMHNEILGKPLASNPPAQAWGIEDSLNAEGWEQTPGNGDGIFQKIVLPVLRAAKDPRLLEYWDIQIKREGDAASRTALTADAERFAQVRRPELLWQRAQDVLLLGQRNRAIGEMFSLVKTFPAHPQAQGWLKKLEQMLEPAPAPAVPSQAPAADAAAK